MPLFVSDFLGDTLDLGPAEVGAYMLLLMAQWNRNGDSLPSDEKKLRLVCRCGREWPKVWAVISRYFERDESGLYNVRLRFEAQKVAAKRAVNAQNGARGGAAKALKGNARAMASATNSLERNGWRNPSIPEPEPDISSGGGSACAREADVLPPDATDRERILVAIGHPASGITATGKRIGSPMAMIEVKRWSDLGLTIDQQIEVIGEVMAGYRASKPNEPPPSLKYFSPAMQRRAGDLAAPSLKPITGGQNERNRTNPAHGDAESARALRAIAAAAGARSA